MPLALILRPPAGPPSATEGCPRCSGSRRDGLAHLLVATLEVVGEVHLHDEVLGDVHRQNLQSRLDRGFDPALEVVLIGALLEVLYQHRPVGRRYVVDTDGLTEP